MSEAPLTSGGDDDLPRTVRQQKEARARDQMAREILNAPRPAYGQAASKAAAASAASSQNAAPSMSSHMAGDYGRNSEYASGSQLPPGEYPQTTVSRFNVPFFHMVGFFLKAVLAAIPALILLGLILWGLGQVAQTYLPWLIKMKILITFP